MEPNISTFMENNTLTAMQTSLSGLSFTENFLSKTISVSFLTVTIVLFVQILRNKRFSKPCQVIEPTRTKKITGVPLISMFTVFKRFLQFGTDFPKLLQTLIQNYGEIFEVKLLGFYSIVFIFNPSMVQKLYSSLEPGHLNKPKWYSKFLIGSLKDGLFASSADTWKSHRGVVSKAFTYKGVIAQISIFEEHAKTLVLNLQETCLNSNSKKMSFDNLVNRVTYDIIYHIAAGKELHDLKQEEKIRYQNNFNRTKELIAYRVYNPLNLLEFMWNVNPKKWEMDRTLGEISRYTDKLITGIRNHLHSNVVDGVTMEDDMVGKSLMELMIKSGLTNAEIYAEIMTFFAAGHDSVTSNLNILMFLLASHKEYQDKCREEVDRMFDKISESQSNEMSMEDLKSLKFVDMCIKESLRLYPSVPIFGRELESPIQLDDRTYLPPNTIVLVSPWIIHHNPKIYPKPEKFYPERFASERVKNMGPCEFMTFSTGPRKCIAFKSVMIELKVLVAYVLHNYEVTSDISFDNLNQIMKQKVWPFPDLGIKVCPRY